MEDLGVWVALFLFVAVSIGGIVLFIRGLYKQEKREKEGLMYYMSRLNEIDYTEIIGSSNGNSGVVTTVNSNGNVGMGSYGSNATTKFLIVYKSGEKEIIQIQDRSPLFPELVKLLK